MKSIVFRELPAHETTWAITTGKDGNVYIGVCGELTDALSVFITRYDPRQDKVDYLLEAGPALNEPSDSGKSPISKIHYCMLPTSDGKFYCATHYSGPPKGHFIWRPWHTWDDPEAMSPGFHIFAFDPQTEKTEDYGIMSPNEGSRAAALAEKRGLIYGVTWPRNHFYVYDLRNRRYRDFGRIGDANPQAVWIDPQENGYTSDDLGRLVKYDADQGKLLFLDQYLPKDPDCADNGRSVYDIVPSPDREWVYGVLWNLEAVDFSSRLFRYHFASGRMEDLGMGHGKDKRDHLGGLVFGDDGYLYYAASRKDSKRRIGYRMYLFRMDPKTGKKEEIEPFDDGEYHSEYIAKATKDFAGNLYFCDCSNRPTRIYTHTPPGCGKVHQTQWPFGRSWG
ncbi:MAG: hypothetical protein PHV34_14975 [Verrucomicrobiae bacterium]|nr:hypothetical protein [Verrucomicrobiae bacterium]